ncbi:MAG: glycosyltransferase family 4 protein [Sulfitobacter sp.]
MQLAFYAPMKPPDHPVPSGERTIARSLIAALELAGIEVALASTMRSRDGAGDTAKQTALTEAAATEITRLIPQGRAQDWQAWITYHNYYKAPDLIGPTVAAALGIPYLQVESTRAKKRLTGAWASFAAHAEAATDAAQVVFYFTERDAETLWRDAPADQHLHHLRPFLGRDTLPGASTLNGPMLSVGMMRTGDKLASYGIIADTLALLPPQSWHLNIAGDGPARGAVETLMAPFGDQVTFLGQLDAETLQAHYKTASLMLWPGVNEALGLAYLEAQAAGVPVVAQDRPGMREVLAPGNHPDPLDGPQALVRHITQLLHSHDERDIRGKAARRFVAAGHLLPSAAATLVEGLATTGVRP